MNFILKMFIELSNYFDIPYQLNEIDKEKKQVLKKRY